MMKQNIIRQGNRTISLLCFLILSFIPILCMVGSADAETVTYNYCDTGELKKVSYSGGAIIEYSYDDSGNRLSQIIISAKPAITASPSSLNFSPITIGSSSTQSVQITNTGSWALEIEGVGISGANPTEFSTANDECSGQSLAPAASCSINVVFSPASTAGTKTAALDIASNAADSPNLQAPLTGTATLDQMHPLTITKAGTGSGTISADTGTITWSGNTGTASYAPGTSVNITALSDPDSIFDSWSGDCIGNGSPCAIQMTSAKAVTATFHKKTDFSATPVSGMAPLTVAFTDHSVNSPTSWQWDFGDGGASDLQNPTHTYTATGYYTVSLTTTGTGGSVTMTKSYYITVWACSNQTVKIGGTLSYYPTVQNACNATTNGDSVQMMALEFSENLELQNDSVITLDGGYGCDFSSKPWVTTINGSLTIKGGTAIIENVILK
jgi:hypothetical protein